MAVTTKQWINTDMHLFIYIRNGPILHQHTALSSARTYIHIGFEGTFWKIASLSAGQGEGKPVTHCRRIKTYCSHYTEEAPLWPGFPTEYKKRGLV